MAEVGQYQIPDRVKGDTSNAVIFTINVNDSPLDLTDATARMHFRSSKTGKKELELSTGGSGLTIIDAENGSIRMDEISRFSLYAGSYVYDLEITLSSGVRKTYVEGTMEVLQDTTY